MSDPAEPVLCTLPLDAVLVLPIVDGRSLVLRPGNIRCSICLEKAAPPEPSDYDWVAVSVEISSASGECFRGTRLVPANLFVDLLRFPGWVPHEEEWRPLVLGLRTFLDRREYIPTVVSQEGRAAAFSYFEDNLTATVDLFSYRSGGAGPTFDDWFIVSVHPVPGGGIGSTHAPATARSNNWLAKIALLPSLWYGRVGPLTTPIEFAAVERTGQSQEAVSALTLDIPAVSSANSS